MYAHIWKQWSVVWWWEFFIFHIFWVQPMWEVASLHGPVDLTLYGFIQNCVVFWVGSTFIFETITLGTLPCLCHVCECRVDLIYFEINSRHNKIYSLMYLSSSYIYLFIKYSLKAIPTKNTNSYEIIGGRIWSSTMRAWATYINSTKNS